MATLKKKKSRLGTPPPKEAVHNNLAEPEVAPATKKAVDGRTLRKTGRTQQFNTSVTKEYLDKLRKVSKEEGRTMAKILELSLEVYLKKS